jgi:hypothetical protein
VIKYSRDLILSVREMLERNWSVYEIAARMNLDADDVQSIIEIIKNIAT